MTISWHDVTPQAPQQLALGEHILGALGVGVVDATLRHPMLSVDMDVLAADADASVSISGITQLRTHLPVTPLDVSFDGGTFKVAQTAEHVFGVLELSDALDIQTASYRAYQALLACCKALGKPHLLRLWNYMPYINAPESGEVENSEERYRLFNTGRRQALHEANYLAKDGAPAACALGSHRGSFKIAFLAATKPCTPIENPRQISAYNYPKDYGVNPPIFARAGWCQQDGGKDILFISGTASIVGHQTLHIGDIALQTRETIANIQAVLQEANRLACRDDNDVWTLRNLHGQVYVRNRADTATIQAILKQHALLNFTYLHADICRADLLVEIEAYAQL